MKYFPLKWLQFSIEIFFLHAFMKTSNDRRMNERASTAKYYYAAIKSEWGFLVVVVRKIAHDRKKNMDEKKCTRLDENLWMDLKLNHSF